MAAGMATHFTQRPVGGLDGGRGTRSVVLRGGVWDGEGGFGVGECECLPLSRTVLLVAGHLVV